MLNLLFISDSPKIEQVKNTLQPLLKVIIDVVTDFDQGLKDVFEKRPTTVCIQDQIGGVTGESVARHIQMLLGKGAPTFILMHEGNPKIRPIRGLFELLIDLSQSDDELLEEIKSTFKVLLGDQWARVYVPPPAAVRPDRSSQIIPPSSRAAATQLVDDLLADLERPDSAEETVRLPDPAVLSTASDEIAELMLAQSRLARQQESPAVPPVVEARPSAPAAPQTPKPTSGAVPPTEPNAASRLPGDPPTGSRPVSAAPVKPAAAKGSAAAASPADFRIQHDSPVAGGVLPEELLFAFDQNYRSGSIFFKRGTIIAAVLLVCLVAVGWYLVVFRPQAAAALKQRVLTLSSPEKVVEKPVAATPSQPVSAPPLRQAVVKPSATPQSLPNFIAPAGLDHSYSLQHPGWERYLGAQTDFRLFRSGTEIKAVQLLAVKGRSLPDTLLRSVLKEFTGSAEYQIVSWTKKQGILILNGSTVNKADVQIYKKDGFVSAMVVSRH